MTFIMKQRNLHKNGFLFKKGDEVDGVFLICTGEFQILLKTPNVSKTSKFPTLIYSKIGQGEIIGLSDIVSDALIREHTVQ